MREFPPGSEPKQRPLSGSLVHSVKRLPRLSAIRPIPLLVLAILLISPGPQQSWVFAQPGPLAAREKEVCIYGDCGRPLNDVTNLLSSRFFAPVVYEDPPFAGPDLQQLIPPASYVVPASVRYRIGYLRDDSPAQALATVIQTHNAAGQGGTFSVKISNGIHCLVPTAARDADGKMRPHQSPLNQPVAFHVGGNVSCLTVLNQVVEAVNAHDRIDKVLLGGQHDRILETIPYPETNIDATSRDVFTDVLRILNRQRGTEKRLWTLSMRYSPPNGQQPPMWILAYAPVEREPTYDFAMLIESSRPMATAVSILQQHYGAHISYEEPQLEHRGDVLGVVGSGKAGLRGGMIKALWTTDQNNVAEILPMVAAGRIEPRNQQGMFAFVDLPGGGFHVYPAQRRDVEGNMVPAASLLSGTIALAGLHGAAEDVLAMCIQRALNDTGKVEVKTQGNGVADALRRSHEVPSDPAAAGARSVIDSSLSTIDPKLAWQLLFDPSLGKHFLFVYRP